jgi:hypothetical protein
VQAAKENERERKKEWRPRLNYKLIFVVRLGPLKINELKSYMSLFSAAKDEATEN